MPRSELHGLFRRSLPVLVLLVILLGVVLAKLTGDPYWMNRCGAVVAAVAAGSILFQLKIEVELEVEEASLRSASQTTNLDLDGAMPVDILASRLSVGRLDLQVARIARHRVVVSKFVAATAILGELLHGFGDILMCWLLCLCRGH